MNKERLKALKYAIEAEQEINESIAKERKLFEEQNKHLFERQTELRERITECKGILTENAEAGFAKDGEKKREGGIGIMIRNDLEFSNEDAFNWAKEHNLCLKLDPTEFKKIAKSQDLDFVKKSERILVTFPKEIKLDDQK